ncbi:GPI mannosyltransferase 4 [Bombina bombina]|uniref:GPI mannosyltransferase 4 n=1 Tax=Bombina bombina TaxID=8345 RepID=UPI00235AA589|nr:GPI mannosyltransferase 4 [Bombina bombina]
MKIKVLWGGLSILRIAWCLVPQFGYLHPDEFFQSPEVMAGDILDLDITRPWEFLPGSPCRTVVIPLLTSGTIFWILGVLQQMGIVTTYCSYLLLVLPRLLITLFSFLLDLSIYNIAPNWGSDRWKAMVLLAGSYVTLVFYTRTLSNAVEGILFALFLLLTSTGSSNRNKTLWTARTNHLLGIILAAGFFNRPTFLGFSFMPFLYWTQHDSTSQFSFRSVFIKVLKLLPCAVPTALVFILADTLYYRGHHLFSFNSTKTFREYLRQNIVLTPLNFLRYNLNPQNLAQHGAHLPFTHLVVNGIMLFGVLHISVVLSGIKLLIRRISQLLFKGYYRSSETKKAFFSRQTSSSLLLFYFVPLALLSLFSHQEPRFLIPLIIPLVLFAANYNIVINRIYAIVLYNMLGAFFFGCLHQAGLVPSLFHIQKTLGSHFLPGTSLAHHTLLFTHTYMPPKYLLCLKKEQNSVDVIDLAGFNKDQLCQKLRDTKDKVSNISKQLLEEKTHYFLVIFPGTLVTTIDKCGLSYTNVTVLFPHLSMEDPPEVSDLLSGNLTTQLGLYIIDVNVHR